MIATMLRQVVRKTKNDGECPENRSKVEVTRPRRIGVGSAGCALPVNGGRTC